MKTRTAIRTEDKIKAMLMEDTGTPFLDSGFAYGRHWERNLHRDFDEEPEISIYISPESPRTWQVSHSLYHFLWDRLTAVKGADKVEQVFHDYCPDFPDLGDMDQVRVMEDFAGNPVVNTAERDNYLDQDIRFAGLDSKGEYVLIQSHNGCDPRGGYSDVRVFRGNWEALLLGSEEMPVKMSCPCTTIGTVDPDRQEFPDKWKVHDPTEVDLDPDQVAHYTRGIPICEGCGQVIQVEVI